MPARSPLMSVTHELRSIGTGWFSFVVTVPHETSGGELPTSRLSVAVEVETPSVTWTTIESGPS